MLALYPNSIILLNIQGIAFGESGQLDKAIQVFQKIVKINPDNAEVYINMGAAFYDKGELDAFLNCYIKALNIKPNRPDWAVHVLSLIHI